MITPFRHRALKRAALVLLAGLALLAPASAFAQEVPGGDALRAYLLLMCVVTGVPIYIYYALATYFIARKTQTENAWMAWIPFANLVLWANIARRPFWWGLLCIVPVVGLVFMVLVWMGIAEARHKPGWWGILSVIPFAGIVVPGYLAWSS
jgi:hypothetical protein